MGKIYNYTFEAVGREALWQTVKAHLVFLSIFVIEFQMSFDCLPHSIATAGTPRIDKVSFRPSLVHRLDYMLQLKTFCGLEDVWESRMANLLASRM